MQMTKSNAADRYAIASRDHAREMGISSGLRGLWIRWMWMTSAPKTFSLKDASSGRYTPKPHPASRLIRGRVAGQPDVG